MAKENAAIAIYNTHNEAEAAIKELHKSATDMKKLSISKCLDKFFSFTVLFQTTQNFIDFFLIQVAVIIEIDHQTGSHFTGTKTSDR